MALTNDVDAKANYPHAVQKEFERLLAEQGKVLDPLSGEVWMPVETRYRTLFDGDFVRVEIAEPEFVLLSKARYAPHKNRALLIEHLAQGASEEFLELAAMYGIDLEEFV